MLVLAALTTLLLFSGSAIAQIYTAKCTQSSWDWTYNSQNQDPCKVAGYLLSTCSGGTFTIQSLPSGYKYTGPSSFDGSNVCKCNTIVYSLLSACGACQGESWFTWSRFSVNCTRPQPPSVFTNPIPAGTHVPQWALIDVTLLNGTWDPTEAMSTGDSPEIGPGELIGVSSSATDGPTGSSLLPTDFPAVTTPTPSPPKSTSSLSPTSSPSRGSSSNTGAIVGGVVGGIGLIAIAVIATFCMQRQRSKAPPAAFEIDGPSHPYNEARKPMSDGSTHASSSVPGSPINQVRVHNPSGSTVFPGHQEVQHARDLSAQPPFSRYNGTGNTPANVNSSLSRGYNGLPMV